VADGRGVHPVRDTDFRTDKSFMGRRLIQSWFLISLVILLPCGMTWGWITTDAWRAATVGRVHPAVTTVLILFLMAFTLDSSKLHESFRAPRPVIWGTIVNLALLPLMAWPFAANHTLPDFSLGLMIAATVPCTLATASVSTRQAGGNDAVSLLVTLVTNVLCVFVTPLWLKWTVAIEADIDPLPIIRNLALTVLLPTLGGQLARTLPRIGGLATIHKRSLSITAQCLVLLIITKAAVEAGGKLQGHELWPRTDEFVLLILECAGLHLFAMVVASAGGRWLQIPRHNLIPTVFAGSQKTLPIGLLLAEMPALTGDRLLPFITFPLLLFHAVQLIMDTAIADQIARRERQSVI
jgi:solute carrier family 10 (sodium/bile acid cotransporter), member 7